MTVRYLTLRSNLYTAVCQCYYSLQQPLQAEVSVCIAIVTVAVLDAMFLGNEFSVVGTCISKKNFVFDIFFPKILISAFLL